MDGFGIVPINFQISDIGRRFSAGALNGIDSTTDDAFMRTIAQGCLLGNQSLLIQADNMLVEGNHAKGISFFHDVIK